LLGTGIERFVIKLTDRSHKIFISVAISAKYSLPTINRQLIDDQSVTGAAAFLYASMLRQPVSYYSQLQ